MKFSIRKKLLLAMFGLNIVILSIVVFFTIQSLDDGSDAMSEEFHIRLLRDQARQIAKHYEYYGRWDEVINDDLVWVQMMFPGSFIDSPQQRFAGAPEYTVEDIINNLPKKGPGRPKPGMFNGRPAQNPPPKNRPKPDGNRPFPPPHSKNTPSFFWLFDKNGEKIMGSTTPKHNFIKVPVRLNNEVVGYIGRPIARELLLKTRNSIFTGASDKLLIGIAIALVFSIFAALALSYLFVKPIKYLSKGMHDLASGNFNRKLTMKSNDEFAALAKDYNFLAQALEQGKTARQQWVRDIAHELRTPLTVISGEIELIQSGIQAAEPGVIETLGEEINQLNRLISDLNTLSQSDLGALNFDKTEFNLADMLRHYSDKLQDKLGQHHLSLSYKCSYDEINIFADEQRLKQLFDNLMQNTIRYTDAPGKVSLLVTKLSDKVVIRWQDSSPGVDEEHLTRLFERLFRVDSSRHRASGGSGLGLSICYSIVKAHLGHINAQKSELGGLTIEITLPL